MGVDPILETVAPNASYGISLFFASNNVIGAPGAGNLIGGNVSNGIYLSILSSNNLIQGNAIGTAPASSNGGSGIGLGSLNLGNGGDGINLSGVSSNTIGGTAAGAGNVVSGNADYGVDDIGGSSTLIQGNLIGTDATGQEARPNAVDGVLVDQSPGSTIGGTASGAGNVISGNTGNGIHLTGGSSGALIQGNKVGTNLAGLAAVSNNADGILLEQSPSATIGGSAIGAGNVVSGNAANGIDLADAVSDGVLIQGNDIGVDSTGAGFVGNSGNGIRVKNSPGNQVLDNVISSNNFAGVFLNGSGASGNAIQGNLIGTDARGDQLSNLTDGIFIIQAPNNTVGGTTPADRNVISANTNNGVSVRGPLASGNLVEGNYIGLDPSGELNLGNVTDGVFIQNAPGNTIGGTASGAGNVISHDRIGVDIETFPDSQLGQAGGVFTGGQSDDNLVEGNLIGTDATGTRPLGNSAEGVLIVAGSGNTIGGTASTAGNVISNNLSNGVSIEASSASVDPTTGNLVEGNKIGTAVDGVAGMGNRASGVFVADAPNSTIGGTASGAANVISGNSVNGISISGAAATTLVVGNLIGVDATGLGKLANSQNGVDVEGAASVTIGAAAGLGRNVISGNGSSGVNLVGGSSADLVQANLIGVAADGSTSHAEQPVGCLRRGGHDGDHDRRDDAGLGQRDLGQLDGRDDHQRGHLG